MQRSSNKIGALAAALAKAQAEITNPEKSLSATIQSPFPREGRRTFRYAPLSAGLEIARKCLGQPEIAAVQSTAFDRDSGLIKLTTTLVHSSGEWVSSDWPVCPVGQTAAPHRMGAALTYARRYGLFTLVGIAGEDDLDAPDLPVAESDPSASPQALPETSKANGRHPAGGHGLGSVKSGARSSAGHVPAAESADLRDRMLSEIAGLSASDHFDSWAFRSLPNKNTLSASDAQIVEAAFAARLSANEPLVPATAPPIPQAIDKSALAFPEPRRVRDKVHLRFVAQQPCLVCGRQPCDPHHVRFAQQRGLGLKVSDEFTVPLCRVHHRELHRTPKEVDWWSRTGIEPLSVAHELWMTTHPFVGQEAKPRDAEGSDPEQAAGAPAALTARTIQPSKLRNEANSASPPK